MSAYSLLKETFARHDDLTFEIEVLDTGVGIPPGQLILQDGQSIGVPKKVLAAAFVEARSVFARRHVKNVDTLDVLHATRIIILFDPEYLTAVNHLKRSFCALEEQNRSDKRIASAIGTELTFLDSVLTSPLHRQTKSPTLWYHRYWLILRVTSRWADTLHLDVQELVRHEWQVVFQAGERHPHNYYAWQYLRRLIAGLDGTYWSRVSHEVTFIAELCHEVTSWCIRHPSDISGWSFLLHFFINADLGVRDEELSNEATRVVDFARDVKWRGEGLWMFLDGIPTWSATQYVQEVRLHVLSGASQADKDKLGET